MTCTLSDRIDQATEVFENNAESYTITKKAHSTEILIKTSKKWESTKQTYQIAKSRKKSVDKWVTENIGDVKLNGSWVHIQTLSDATKVTISIPTATRRVILLKNKIEATPAVSMEGDYTIDGTNGNVTKEGTQGILFQLKDPVQADMNGQLDEKLRELLLASGIRLKTMEEYYAKKKNPNTDAIGLADIINGVIAYSENSRDGNTLPEETGHFLEGVLFVEFEGLWNKLFTAKNDKGQDWLAQTPQYKKSYGRYLDLYGNATAARREIIGQVFGQYIKEKHEVVKIEEMGAFRRSIVKVLGLLNRALKHIINKFRGISTTKIPTEIDKIFKDKVSDFYNGEIINYNKVTLDNTTVAAVTKTRLSALSGTIMKNLITRRDALVRERSFLDKDLRDVYTKLEAEYAGQDVTRIINDLVNRSHKSKEDMADLEKAREYMALKASTEREKRAMKSVKKLDTQIANLKRNIAERLPQEALENFILGHQVYTYDWENPGILPTVERKKGLIEETENIKELIAALKAEAIAMTPEIIEELRNYSQFYTEDIINLNTMISTGEKFEELSKPKEFVEAVKNAFTDLNDINNYIDGVIVEAVALSLDAHNTNLDGSLINPELNSKEEATAIHGDRNFLSIAVGDIRNASSVILQTASDMIQKVRNHVNRFTADKAVDIYNTFRKATDILEADAAFMSELKKMGISSVSRSMSELDGYGNPTGFVNNEFQLEGAAGFTTARNNEVVRINREVEAFAATEGIKIVLDDDTSYQAYNNRMYELQGSNIAIRTDLTADQKKEELAKYRKIQKKYNNGWSAWYTANTVTHPDVDQIIEDMKDHLSTIQFTDWSKRNIKTSEEGFRYYVGELSIPANKYKSKSYATLSKNATWKALNEFYIEELQEGKKKIPSYMASSYQERMKQPQISRSGLDILYSTRPTLKSIKGMLRGAKEAVTDNFIVKQDDEIFGDRSDKYTPDGQVIKYAPVRFNGLLKNMEELTPDAFHALIAYHEMAESYKRNTEIIPTLEMYKHHVGRSTFSKSFSGDTHDTSNQIKGVDSNTYKNLVNYMAAMVYGEKKIADTDSARQTQKITSTLANYWRKLALAMNTVSATAGTVNAVMNLTLIETAIGRMTNGEAVGMAIGTFTSNLYGYVKDMGNPVKTNKVSAIMDKIQVLSSTREIFNNLDKGRFTRLLSNLDGWALWRAADLLPKTVASLSVMHDYRKIDGVWYTRRQWLENKTNTREGWKTHEKSSFYNTLEFTDGKLDSKEISEEAWDRVMTMSINLSEKVDNSLTEVGKAEIRRHAIMKFATLFRDFLFQLGETRFKNKHFNKHTQLYEEGTYKAAYKGLGKKLKQWSFGADYAQLSDTEKEGLTRVAAEIIAANIVAAIAITVNKWAVDDDEWDNPFSQFLAYLSTRILLERSAPYSPSELFEILDKPLVGVNGLKTMSSLFKFLTLDWNEGSEEVGHSSPYAGKSKRLKTALKLVPGVKAAYEGFPFDTPLSNGAVGNRMKNTTIKNKVINEGFLTIISRILFGKLKDVKRGG